jgi:1-phosphofructokinase family hexose kinase
MSIRTEAVATAKATRMNLEILENDGTVTEVLEPGQPVTTEELQRLREAFGHLVRGSAGKMTAILSGSLPLGVPENYYATLIELGHEFGCRVVVDTSGEPLRHALKAGPDFVKPNQQEAEWLSGGVIEGPGSAGYILKMLFRDGARAGAISLGSSGLVWQGAQAKGMYFAKAPEMVARSTVGSGDSTLAGFAFAEDKGLEAEECLRLAAACGAANCLAEGAGRARATDIERLKKEIHVESL